MPLLIVAIIAQGDFFRPALAFTSLPFVTKSCTARTHVLQRTKGRSKHVTVPTSRIVAEGWELPALGEIKEYRLDYTEAADTSLGVAATAVESGPESNEGVKRVADARTAPRLEFDWKLAREQGRHRYEMAKQRMELLEVCACGCLLFALHASSAAWLADEDGIIVWAVHPTVMHGAYHPHTHLLCPDAMIYAVPQPHSVLRTPC